jgi:hypothetical protein
MRDIKVFVLNPYVSSAVQDSVECQYGIAVEDIEIVNGIFDPIKPKYVRIAQSKDISRLLAIQSGCDFAILHDNDLLNLYDTNYDEMVDFLKLNTLHGAVSLFRGSKDHVCDGVICIRREALRRLRFYNRECRISCHSVIDSLDAAGWLYSFLDDKIRIKQIKEANNE